MDPIADARGPAAHRLERAPASASAARSRPFQSWRAQAFGVLRVVFGLVWAVDAAFKWTPAFQTGFVTYLTGALDGQPLLVRAWIGFWIDVVKVNPQLFATVVALGETALAVGLILGVLSNVATVGGLLLTLVIWTTAEGFGGPYAPGSTDVGTAIIYFFVFIGLFLAQAGLNMGLDRRLTPALGWWGWLASGPLRSQAPPKAEASCPANSSPT
jgi:uncharacterized membrane protein YphA (DoxX/SURF4 family)